MYHRTKPGVSRRGVLRTGLMSAVALPLAGLPGFVRAAPGEKITVMLLGPNSDLLAKLNDQLLPQFTEQTGIPVTLQTSDWGSGFQKVTTAAASRTLADVIMLGGIWTAPLADKGALLPIDDFLPGWADKDAIYPAMLEDGAYDGKHYAVPIYADTRTALYRRDILEKAGIDPAALPTNWAEYRAMAEAIAGADTSASRTPAYWDTNKSIGLQQAYAQLMLQAGGTYYGEDGKAQFASEPGVDALTYLVGYFADGLSDINQVYTGSGPTPLVQGSAAMTFSGYSQINNANDNAPDAAALLIAGPPLSKDPGGTPITSAWINKLAISANTKNPDAAWQFLTYMMSSEVDEVLAKEFGGLPGRKDLADAAYLANVPSGLTAAADYIVPQPPHPNMLVIAKEINTAVEKAVRQMGTPEEVLAELDGKIDQINGV